MNKRLSILAGCAAITLVSGTMGAHAYTGQELAKHASIGIAQARATALKAHPGAITDEELEKERGGAAFATLSTSSTDR